MNCFIGFAAYLAIEWNHVVLAQGKDLNISDNHELVMILMEDSTID